MIGVFANARGISQVLSEWDSFGPASYYAIKEELGYLVGNLEELVPILADLPPTILLSVTEIAEIVQDAKCNISFADVCVAFQQSELEPLGKRGWRELLRLTQPPAVTFCRPALETPEVIAPLSDDRMKAETPEQEKPKRRGRKKADFDTVKRESKQTTSKGNSNGDTNTKALIIAALNEHHQYSNGRCEDVGHAGVNKLAKHLGISPSTVSGFFKTEFGGHDKYRWACSDTGKLAKAFAILNDELTPGILYNSFRENDGNLAGE